MSLRGARTLAAVFWLLFLAAVTWPGMVPFNRAEPRVLGLPLSMAWVALWVAVACGVLLVVDRVETRHRDREGDDDAGRPGGPERPERPRRDA